MSGYPEGVVAKRVGESSPSAFIKKPYRSIELVRKLQDILE